MRTFASCATAGAGIAAAIGEAVPAPMPSMAVAATKPLARMAVTRPVNRVESRGVVECMVAGRYRPPPTRANRA
ncbi:MAG: hypothetical protein ACK56F_19090, partial [bacterium]